MKESGKRDIHKGEISCPIGWGIYYRVHGGDENGNTTYRYGRVKLLDAENLQPVESDKADEKSSNRDRTMLFGLTFGSENQQSIGKESSSDWTAENGYILTGRKHAGDENAITFMYSRPICVKRAVFFGRG